MDLRSYVEHTCLRADATEADIERLSREALDHRLFGVCVNPLWVAAAEGMLRGSLVRLVAVVGFPLGANRAEVKAEEARLALSDGAHEIDMVIAVGRALEDDFRAVAADISSVRSAAEGAVLKVILETGYLDPARLRKAAEVCIEEGADFVKTCTGFGPRGASVDDVALLSEVSAGRARIKASGGIRTKEDAERMIAAGASRIGTSQGVAIVAT